MDSHYHDDVVYAEAGGFLEIAPGALAQTEAVKPNSGWLAGMWSGPGGRAIHGSTFCGLELQPTTSDRIAICGREGVRGRSCEDNGLGSAGLCLRQPAMCKGIRSGFELGRSSETRHDVRFIEAQNRYLSTLNRQRAV